MKLFAQLLLAVSAAVLIAYPGWSMLNTELFAREMLELYPDSHSATEAQLRQSAAALWIANGTLAAALLMLAAFIRKPTDIHKMYASGILLFLYPIVQTAVQVYSGVVLTTHAEEVQLGIEISAQKAFFLVLGAALIGVGAAIATVDTKPG